MEPRLNKQKATDTRQLVGGAVAVILLGLAVAVVPVSATSLNANWNFFARGTVFVLALSVLLHLFYFSWLSSVPLKDLLLPIAAVHFLFIMPALIAFAWSWQQPDYGIFGQRGFPVVVSIFVAAEFIFLRTRFFASIVSHRHIGWLIPVLILSACTMWALGAIFISAILVAI